MTETILLVIFGIIIFLGIWAIRKKGEPAWMSARIESIIRFSLCVLFALIAHAYFRKPGDVPLVFAVAVIFNAAVIYTFTHVPDRWFLKA